jgi:hypothetical protein
VSQLDTGGVSEKPFRGVTAVTPEPSLTIIEPSVTHAPISKEIFDKANKEVDAILDFERKAQQRKEAGTSWFGRDKLNDQQRLLLDTFVRITGQRPTKDTFSDWLLTSSQWVELEIQPADLVNAYAQSNPTEGKGFTVARPGSLTNVAGMFAGKRRVGGGEVGGTHLDKIMTRLQSSHETFQRPARG